MIVGRYDEAEEEYNNSINEIFQSRFSSSVLNDELDELNKVNIGWIMIKRKDFQSANQIFIMELKNQLLTEVGKLIKKQFFYINKEIILLLFLSYVILIFKIIISKDYTKLIIIIIIWRCVYGNQ